MYRRLVSKKDYKKFIRGIIEGIVLLLLLIILLKSLFNTTSYEPFTNDLILNEKGQEDTGFIALAYLGVSRMGADTVISTQRLEEHLEALYNNGYVTITQQDVIDYYTKDKKLPKKALFLIFEDGYTGTAIFAQKILEKYNFKATMVTYGDKMFSRDSAFLDAKDLGNLERSTFWEIGTNGYRLSYINVFNKENHYIGELESTQFNILAPQLGRNYNHYLMDYIRDDYGIPKETYAQMKERIIADYELLEKAYKEGIGYIPQLHVLMHANTGAFGNNQKVSDLNEQYIKLMFAMNFNREGFSFNNKVSTLYDLTRMQGQGYWYPNHLLMRIQDDSKVSVTFVIGDDKRTKDWELIRGAAEYRGEDIVLTSESKSSGLIRLKESTSYENYIVSTRLTGNVIGSQSLYLRADDNLENYIKIQIVNNQLYVYECIKNKESLLYEKKISEEDDNTKQIEIHDKGAYALKVILNKDTLQIQLDEEILEEIFIGLEGKGSLYLESSWVEGYSQRNLYDDVYDGVFEQVVISTVDNQTILYDNRYDSYEKMKKKIEKLIHNIVNWFIETL